MVKNKKQYIADRGAYILSHMPECGAILDQDAYTMQMLNFICDELTSIRRPK